ncbi:MAG: DegT/DnrJ/EryC1/StrS family aminotransferase [Lachnospiraceae bacterium]|nr:DegT/DnrJ/EryC1/StrS family aminotransferase [Lachnospiraceae bacterium]
MRQIPLFNLNYDETEVQAVTEVIYSKWISSGPKCKELERLFCDFLNVQYAYAVANCTSALHLALKVLGIAKDDEVIVPSFTFVATANAVRYVGAIPVFCDIDSTQDLTLSVESIEKSITSKTKAIIVMHYAGFPCNMDKIMKIAKERHLYVIEDACHGPLSEYKGVKLGTIGDIGCFSFYANKNVSAGEGGMVVTNYSKLGEKVKLLRSHGMTVMSYDKAKGHATGYDVVELGYNYRMDDIRAALAISQLKKLSVDIEKRKELREQYINRLAGCSKIIIPFIQHKEYVSNYIFPIILKNSNIGEREEIRKQLSEAGIQTSVHYPAVHKFGIYREAGSGRNLSVTEYVSDCEITLPLYGGLEMDDLGYVCDNVIRICEGRGNH